MQKYTAIILASREANEYDRMYLLYTKEAGLVKAVGRGVRKPAARLAGHLEPGTLSEIYVARARGMGQITSAITIENFAGLKKSLARLSEVLAVFRFFVKNFAEGERDEKIFGLLRGFMRIFNKADNAGIIKEAFWWKLFGYLGIRPEVMKCAACRKKLAVGAKKFFSLERGGTVCAACPPGLASGLDEAGAPRVADCFPISDNQVKLLRVFLGNTFAKIAKVRANESDLHPLANLREKFEKYNF